jgi:Tfp pilus assembly protein PilN
MRPINLIPEDQRRSHGTTTRTGPLAYLIVGALGVLLLGVVMMVLTSNQISERKGQVATLEGERAVAAAKADALQPYVNFKEVAEARIETVGALADNRFDWPRVIRQLSLTVPPGVYLTTLTASASGSEGSASSPNLQISGCAPTQATVAAFVASLKEIDGVTRVGLESSTRHSKEGEKSSEGSGCEASGVFNFGLTVVFDGAPASVDGATVEVAPEAEPSTEGESGAEGEASTEEAPAPAEPSTEESVGTQASAGTEEPVG